MGLCLESPKWESRRLFSEKFIEVALENASKPNQHINAGVVQAVFHLAENSGGNVDALQLQPGNHLRGFHAALFPEPADV